MSENNEKISNQAKEVKEETVETAKKIKETVKNVNIKEETAKTKNFILAMFNDPIGEIKRIANDDSNHFKTALFVLIIWTIAVFIKSTYSTIYYWGLERVFYNILGVLKEILVPVIGVFVYVIIVFLLDKNKSKKMTSIISTITAAQLPMVISSIISILTIISRDFSKISVTINGFCMVIATVLSYFGFKSLLNEEDDSKFIKKFVIIQLIYYAVAFVLTFLGIFIY